MLLRYVTKSVEETTDLKTHYKPVRVDTLKYKLFEEQRDSVEQEQQEVNRQSFGRVADNMKGMV